MNKVIYPLLAIAFITCIACQNKSTETDKVLQVTTINTESSVSTIEASPDMTDVILTDKQVKSLKITVGIHFCTERSQTSGT